MTAIAAQEKHDLTKRKLPIAELIMRAALKKRVEQTVIRKELEKRLGITDGRMSQMINAPRRDDVRFKQIYIRGMNAFFTEMLNEKIRIEAEYSENLGGLFADL
jgi:hypothetical protein